MSTRKLLAERYPEVSPLDEALEDELKELILRRRMQPVDLEHLTADMVTDSGWLRPWLTAVKDTFHKRQEQLNKEADYLDKLNASLFEDERLSAVAADMRKAAADLLPPSKGKGGRPRDYPSVTWELMSRLTKSGFSAATAAKHTEVLLNLPCGDGASYPSYSIERLWGRRHKNGNK